MLGDGVGSLTIGGESYCVMVYFHGLDVTEIRIETITNSTYTKTCPQRHAILISGMHERVDTSFSAPYTLNHR